MPHLSKVHLNQLFIVRALALVAFAVGLLYLAATTSDSDVITESTAALVVLASITAISAWYFREKQAVTDLQLSQQIAVDILGWSFLMYLTGGANNPFISYLLVPVIISAAVLHQKFTAVMALAALLAYSLLLQYHLPFSPLSPAVGNTTMHGGAMSNTHILGMWFNFALSAALVVLVVSRMAHAMRQREQKAAKLRENSLRDEQIHAIATMAATTAHELGTPLNTLSLYADELKHLCGNKPEVENLLNAMEERLDQCGQITRKLASRAEIDKLRAQSSQLAQPWLEGVIAQWKNKRPEAHIALQTDEQCQDASIKIDQTLAPAIENLLNNALEAGSELIEVSLSCSGKEIQIAIRDYGSGIPSEILTQIGKTVIQDSEKGLGIGLMLTHATINNHGGSLLHHQPADGGTLTTVILPRERC
ncbi:MAG: sensor histidine kinase [Aequoribacter sp.]|jgi:two-component system sensor histidine kinase RegB|uniref:sensor histidine kinase n=1 Tax=Aequoribacter sp. TaxID=2847771 RepID=UPI003C6079EA